MASNKQHRTRRGRTAPVPAETSPLAQAGVPAMGLTRVGKVMHPGMPGTLRLQRRFGPALLAVRYRYDWTGLHRYTTVELLVDASPVIRGPKPDTLCILQLLPGEQKLEHAIRQLGGHFDLQLQRWMIPGHAIQQLGLSDRVEFRQVSPTLHRKHR